MGKGIEISVREEVLELLPERAIHWKSKKTLIVTDLHWGKSETFRLNGVPIPDALMDEELQRLSQVIEETSATRIIVLGDLIHAKIGMTKSLINKVAEWRKTFSGKILVIKGNHDRSWKSLPLEWNIEWITEWNEEPFSFSHEPQASKDRFVWSGHLHPTFRVKGRSDAIRLPCFHVGKQVGVLPAFNFFTRGLEMPRGKTDKVYVIAEDKVIKV